MRAISILIPLLVLVIGGGALWMQHSRGDTDSSRNVSGAQRPHLIALLTEAVGYIGAILVLAGISVAIGQPWADIPVGGRLAILGSVTAILLGVGWLIRGSVEPAFERWSESPGQSRSQPSPDPSLW